MRDVTPGEDASLVRSGAQPQVLAALRTTPLTRLRAAGWRNIGAAIRHPTRCPRAAFRLLGVCRT